MAPRRKTISVSILDIKDAGSAARRDVRYDPKDTDAAKVLDYSLGLKKTNIRSGWEKDVPSPKDLPTNAISFCYSADSDTDCAGLGGHPGTILDFSSISNSYRTQLLSTYMSSDLYFRSQNGDSNGVWNPWVRLYHTGNKPTPKEIGGVTYAGTISFGNSSGTWSTNEFIDFIKSLGVLSSSTYEYWAASGSWNYSGNKTINGDTTNGCGNISLAGAFVEVIGRVSNYVIRITTATTNGVDSSGLSREFVYVNNGPGYSPGWRASYNTVNKPQPTDIGTTASTGLTLAMRDSSGDLHCRLLRSEYSNQEVVSGAMAFRVNNSSDNYIRFCSNTEAIRNWLGVPVNYSSGVWSGIINKVPYVNSSGVMEIGKYIDFHDTDSTTDYNVRLACSSSTINVFNVNGSIEIGAQNASYGHIYTDRPLFAFNKGIRLNNTDSNHWLGMRESTNCFSTLGAVATASASAIIRQEHADRHWMVAGLGNSQFGFYMINKTQTVNGTDASAYLTNDGDWVASRNGNFTDVYIRSDIRDKDNVKYINDPLTRVKQMCGVTYDVKSQSGWFSSGGLISQHVEKGLPEAVTLDKNFEGKSRQRVNYNAVVGLLVNCVNVLEHKLEVLSSKFEKLNEVYNELTS